MKGRDGLEQEVIIARTRSTGTGAARALRRQGLIPGVVYGKDIDSLPISLAAAELRKITAKGMGHIHRLKVEDTGLDDNIMIQAVDRNPLTGDIIHMDLHRISLEDKIRLEVPIVLVGEEEITGRGLILQRQLREVSIECLPVNIPSDFTVNVTEMEHGETLLAGDLTIPDDVRLVTAPEEVVAVVLVSRITAEEADEEEEADVEAGEADSEADEPESIS